MATDHLETARCSALQVDQISRLKPIDRHCYDLSQVIVRAAVNMQHEKAAEWLHIASGIDGITFDGSKFDEDIGWCGPADEYLSANDELKQEFLRKLTVFNYVWLAAESVIEAIVPKAMRKSGKINGAIEYLSRNSNDTAFLEPGRDLLERLYTILSQSPNYMQFIARFKLFSGDTLPGLGLFVVYGIRNSMAHGTLSVPVPDGENRPRNIAVAIPEISTRIVLLSIQVILRCEYKRRNNALRVAWLGLAPVESEEDLEDEDCMPVHQILGMLQFTVPEIERCLFLDPELQSWY